MNYMQDALNKKKQGIVIEINVKPQDGSMEQSEEPDLDDADIADPQGYKDQTEDGADNENKGMAPDSKQVQDETKQQVMNDSIQAPDGHMDEKEIAGYLSDGQGMDMGKPRSLQGALMKKANGMRG